MKRFLYITPYSPPGGQIGAKRALSLARRLPEYGWQPVVLASPNLTGSTDPSLMPLVPNSLPVAYDFKWFLRPLVTRIARLLSKDKGIVGRKSAGKIPHVTPLDQYMWDIPGAVGRALKLGREHDCEAVVVNADPWSGMVVGTAVSLWSGLPLVLDLRDPWSLSRKAGPHRPAVVQATINILERFMFSKAAAVVLNTELARLSYEALYGRAFTTIRNAFDPQLLGATGEPEAGFTVHYFGKLSRLADPKTLLLAFQQFADSCEEERPKLIFYGPVEEQETLSAELIEFRPPVGLAETAGSLSKASVLVLDRGPQDELQLPLKLYDYMACGRPILALSDHRELNKILEETGAGTAVGFGDREAAVEALHTLRQMEFVAPSVEEFGAERLAERYADLLHEVVAGKENPHGPTLS